MKRLDEVLSCWLSMLETAEAMKKELDTRLRDQFSVSLAGFDILAALNDDGGKGLRAGALTKRLRVSDGATSQVAAKLEKAGLIVRDRMPSDRRAVLVRLTPQGNRLFRAMARAHHDWLLGSFSTLSSEDLTALSKLVGRIDSKSVIKLKSEENA